MVERTIAWLARGNRKVRYRGVAKNDHWLHHRAAALNLRRLIGLGLSTTAAPGRWPDTQATVTTRTPPGPTGHSRNPAAIHNRHTHNFGPQETKTTNTGVPKHDCSGH